MPDTTHVSLLYTYFQFQFQFQFSQARHGQRTRTTTLVSTYVPHYMYTHTRQPPGTHFTHRLHKRSYEGGGARLATLVSTSHAFALTPARGVCSAHPPLPPRPAHPTRVVVAHVATRKRNAQDHKRHVEPSSHGDGLCEMGQARAE